ncbi:MAG: CPBP family intramembrane metalloprotease [bacterium]|nr:CPBP family intramembrane metalloprotease [bacterium]
MRPTRPPWPGLAKPLEALVFLLPLIVFSEVVSVGLSSEALSASSGRVVSFHLLRIFFGLFGSTGILMPALAVVGILLGAQVASRRPWKVRWSAVVLLPVEAVGLALPLILLNHWVQLAGVGDSVADGLGAAALGVGAGIYEELIFRLVLISIVVVIGSDLLGRPRDWTLVAGVLLSALLFAAHHHPPVGADPFDAGRFVFRTLAGGYLGGVFVLRGYGSAAGTHAAYNLVVLWLS